MDGSNRRRRKQGGTARRAAAQARPLRLLQRGTAECRSRPVAVAGYADLCLFRATGIASSEKGALGRDFRNGSFTTDAFTTRADQCPLLLQQRHYFSVQ